MAKSHRLPLVPRNRIFFFLLLCAFVLLPFPASANPVQRGQVALALQSSGVLFFQGVPACSSTFRASDEIITAFHCTRGEATNSLIVVSSRKEEARVTGILWSCAECDLVILKLDRKMSGVRIPVLNRDIGVGDPVWLVGIPNFILFTATKATISNIYTTSLENDPEQGGVVGTRKQQYLLLDGFVWYGHSGGAVYGEDGSVKGLIVRTIRGMVDSKTQQVLQGIAISPEHLVDLFQR